MNASPHSEHWKLPYLEYPLSISQDSQRGPMWPSLQVEFPLPPKQFYSLFSHLNI